MTPTSKSGESIWSQADNLARKTLAAQAELIRFVATDLQDRWVTLTEELRRQIDQCARECDVYGAANDRINNELAGLRAANERLGNDLREAREHAELQGKRAASLLATLPESEQGRKLAAARRTALAQSTRIRDLLREVNRLGKAEWCAKEELKAAHRANVEAAIQIRRACTVAAGLAEALLPFVGQDEVLGRIRSASRPSATEEEADARARARRYWGLEFDAEGLTPPGESPPPPRSDEQLMAESLKKEAARRG